MRVSQFKTITGTADGQTLIGASDLWLWQRRAALRRGR